MSSDPISDSSNGNLTLQRWLLRFAAIMLFTGLPGAVLPGMAIEKFSWMMGYGQPNLGPMMVYLSGNAGYVFATFGLVIWVISNDLVRYHPLVVLIGWIFLIAGPAYVSIDLQSHLPWWWVMMDSVSSLLLGGGILWACRPGKNGD